MEPIERPKRVHEGVVRELVNQMWRERAHRHRHPDRTQMAIDQGREGVEIASSHPLDQPQVIHAG